MDRGQMAAEAKKASELIEAVPPMPTDWLRNRKEETFHYTSMASFISIVENREIWGAHQGHLNDPRETVWAEEYIVETCRAFLEGKTTKMAQRMAELFRTPVLFGDFYITSFCADGDLLNQWRLYGANGPAVSLGFLPEFGVNSEMVECIYGVEARAEIAPLVVQTLSELVDALEPEFDDVTMAAGLTMHRMRKEISIASAYSKHEGFREEQEARFVVPVTGMSSEKIHYRPSAWGLAPYVRHSIHSWYGPRVPAPKYPHSFALRSVTLGPSQASEAQRKAVKGFLNKHGFADVEVRLSEAAIR